MPRLVPSPLAPDVRKKSADRISEVVLDLLGLQSVAKKAHWNIRGERFLVLHPLFGEIYDAAAEHADKLAEHVAFVLGFFIEGDHFDVAEKTVVKRLPTDAKPDEIPRAVYQATIDVLAELKDAKKEVLLIGDDDGQQLLLDASIALSKLAGFLAAQIEDEDDEAPSKPGDLARIPPIPPES